LSIFVGENIKEKSPENNLLSHINAAKNPQSSWPTGFYADFSLDFPPEYRIDKFRLDLLPL